MIRNNNYFEGNVQSLGFSDDGQDRTVGVVVPGDYDFGVATRQEIMKVPSGVLTINGKAYFSSDDPCIIDVGEKILISTTSISSYLCTYN
jgi:hypothetical protein